jgi:hypothetical protein
MNYILLDLTPFDLGYLAGKLIFFVGIGVGLFFVIKNLRK